MGKEVQFYRRKLPHYQPHDAIFFITFRLAGSLPKNVIIELKQEHSEKSRLLLHDLPSYHVRQALFEESKRYLARFDKFLDGAQHGLIGSQMTALHKLLRTPCTTGTTSAIP